MRVDLYTAVHKGQRVELFNLAVELGRADWSDENDKERLVSATRAMLARLRDHAHNEETYIHPVLARVLGDGASELHREHNALEVAMRSMEELLEAGRLERLYAAFARFVGDYLVHLDAEERLQEQALWPRVDDATLAEVFARFKAERAPRQAAEDLRSFLPALSAPELTTLFTDMRASAPSSVIRDACALAAELVSPPRWRRVQAALGDPSLTTVRRPAAD